MSGGDHLRLGPGREFDLIRRFLPRASRFGEDDVIVGPGDDCTIVRGEGLAISTDLTVEGVHFRREWLTPAAIGYRAASVALSDLAAVGARPIGLLSSLAIGEADVEAFAVEIMEGVHTAAERVGGAVLGGDLTRSPGPIVIDVVAVGEARTPVLRSGAAPGDEVWITGALGAASFAVARLLLGERPPEAAMTAFERPIPRVPEARWLVERGIPRAMIDLSDGLTGDAAHLAAASGVAIVLDPEAIPLHPAVVEGARSRVDALRYGASGGEDYELCFVVRRGALDDAVVEFETEFALPLHRVGVVEAGAGVFWGREGGGRDPVATGAFQHF
jgi:thiamine-monophosphate kinase